MNLERHSVKGTERNGKEEVESGDSTFLKNEWNLQFFILIIYTAEASASKRAFDSIGIFRPTGILNWHLHTVCYFIITSYVWIFHNQIHLTLIIVSTNPSSPFNFRNKFTVR